MPRHRDSSQTLFTPKKILPAPKPANNCSLPRAEKENFGRAWLHGFSVRIPDWPAPTPFGVHQRAEDLNIKGPSGAGGTQPGGTLWSILSASGNTCGSHYYRMGFYYRTLYMKSPHARSLLPLQGSPLSMSHRISEHGQTSWCQKLWITMRPAIPVGMLLRKPIP